MAINLGKEIRKILNEYEDNIIDGVNQVTTKVSRQSAKKLRNTSPVRTGEYAKSWTSTVEEKIWERKGTVYNKEHYQLTHLLEKGHANRDGSRTPAKVHVKPVEEEAVREFEDGVKKVIENG